MNAPLQPLLLKTSAVQKAIAAAVESIAPNWPLDRMIAVNPYWGRIQQPFSEVAAHLAQVAGSPMTLPLAAYRQAWEQREIEVQDLQQALRENQAEVTLEQAVAALEQPQPEPLPLPLLSDQLDSQRDLRRQPAWCDTITHQVSQFCAAWFDREQADWHPDQAGGLYAAWRDGLRRDHSVALLMQAPGIPAQAAGLAEDPEQQISNTLAQLGVGERDWPLYLQAVLMRVSGWAAWCAYLRWQARLEGGDDHALVDLLAIRLGWESLLDDGVRDGGSTWSAWQANWRGRALPLADPSLVLHQVWQRAQEISYQRSLRDRLMSGPRVEVAEAPAVQAAFCIDVRSELLRRHLEAQSTDIQTLGFAGFFGLPISYAPLGTTARRPQLPGLLPAALHISDSTGSAAGDAAVIRRRGQSLSGMLGWRVFQSVPLSSFTLVEALGLGYLGKLVQRSLPGAAPPGSPDSLGLGAQAGSVRPTLDAATAGGVAGQAQIAARVLGAMGLGQQFGRLVLLLGHGSQNRNNPQRAGLDCGACCGQTGEVNARALAGLLNDPAVREQQLAQGVRIPDSTVFVAGLHNTTTDEVLLYDLEDLPASHATDLQWIRERLAAAGAGARRERASALGLAALLERKPEALLRAVRERADDWAQTRPEWGLANNAAFIVAPRARTRGVDLQGRSFLHDYDYRKDRDGSLLELIMTAPMVVTHWINMQYYASTVDNQRYGSGNKTLHNVTGGRIGVFEGNGGDLRIGLPWQSLHDGERCLHTPLRLTVVIEAPREAIDSVIAKHVTVRQLLDNHWLYLARLDGERMERYGNGSWQIWAE
ncbi:MAG: DUF2309 domain-containing protein [Haliea sp.]|uniref:YbcC family protein n=1 Tax=Haliea sp. TaxID=1932666 RepID=UPI0032F045E7